MESWNLNELEVQPHQPEVLDSESEGRAILLNLPKGEQMQEHQVHERAWLLVIDGNVELNTSDGKWASGGPASAMRSRRLRTLESSSSSPPGRGMGIPPIPRKSAAGRPASSQPSNERRSRSKPG